MQLFRELARMYDNATNIGVKTYKTIPSKENKDETYTIMQQLKPFHHGSVTTHITVTIDVHTDDIHVAATKAHVVAPITYLARNNAAAHFLHDTCTYVAKGLEHYYPTHKNAPKKYQQYEANVHAWLTFAKANGYAYEKIERVYRLITNTNALLDACIAQGVLTLNHDGHLYMPTKQEIDANPSAYQQHVVHVKPPNIDSIGIYFNVTNQQNPYDVTIEDDPLYHDSFKQFILQHHENREKGVCHITGTTTDIMLIHPANIIRKGDSSKLVSIPSNKTMITYQGRFKHKQEAFGTSYEETVKAYHMLNYVHQQHARKIDNRTYIMWVDTNEAHTPIAVFDNLEHHALFQEITRHNDGDAETIIPHILQLLHGHYRNIKGSVNVHYLVLDNPTNDKGTLSILDYRIIDTAHYQDMLAHWYTHIQWQHTRKKGLRIPSPYQLAQALQQNALPENTLIQQLIQSMWLQQPIPHTIERIAYQQAIKPQGIAKQDTHAWGDAITNACHIIAYNLRKKGTGDWMTLQTTHTEPAYLYGRLIAIAEKIEEDAALLANTTKKETNAKKVFYNMQMHPMRTWQMLYNKCIPYMRQLPKGKQIMYERLIDDIMALIPANQPTTRQPLNGQFLIGYSHQRKDLYKPKTGEQAPLHENTTQKEETTHVE